MVSVLLLSRSVVLFLCFMRIASEGSGEENFGTNGSTTTTDFQDGTSSTSSRVEWTSSGVESASLSSSPLRSTADTTPSTSASSTAASTSTILTTTESGRIRCRDISRMEIEAFYEPNDDFCAYFIPISIIEGEKFKLLQNDKNAGSSEFLANSTVAACNKLGNEFDALETPIFGSQPDLIYVCCQNCSHPDVNPENKADKERLMLTMMAKFIRQKTVNERKPDTPTQASCKKDSTEAYMSSSQHSTWCASYDGRDISWTMSLSTNWCFLTWNNETISAGHYTKQREANLGNPPKCDGCKGEPHYDIDGAWNSCAEDNVTNTFTCCCWNTNDQVGNGTACNADMAKWTRLRLSSSLVKPDAKMIERKFCAYRSEENISCASLPKFHGCSLHHVHRSNATGAQRNTKVACVSPESEDPTLSAIHDLCLKFPVTEEGRLSCGSMQRDFSEVINFCCCEGIQSCNNAYDVLGRKFNRVGGEDEYEHLD